MADPTNRPQLSQKTTPSNHQQDLSSTKTAPPDQDADLEMEDDTTRDSQAQQGQATSSSTLNHETATQRDTQPSQQQTTQSQEHQPSTSSQGPPPSRKDASLREFLSKMDEYAPIVS